MAEEISEKIRRLKNEKVVIADDALSQAGAAVKKLTPCGAVCIAYCRGDEAAARRIEKSVASEGYTVVMLAVADDAEASEETAAPFFALSEDIRAFVGTGGAELAETLKYVAAKKDAGFVYAPTRDFGDNLFYGEAEFSQERESPAAGVSPSALLFDCGLFRYDERAQASAFGCLFSKYTALFERYFIAETSASDACGDDAAALAVLNGFFSKEYRAENCERLLDAVADFGILASLEEGRRFESAEHVAARCAYRQNKSLSTGEYGFLYGCLMPRYYHRILSFEGIDLTFPPDKIKSVKYLNEKLGISIAEGVYAADRSGAGDYLKTEYLVGEFKEDFSEFLEPIIAKIPLCARGFRRIYADAGYFLRNKTAFSELVSIMSACAIMVDKSTFLSYLKCCGHLERYLDAG